MQVGLLLFPLANRSGLDGFCVQCNVNGNAQAGVIVEVGQQVFEHIHIPEWGVHKKLCGAQFSNIAFNGFDLANAFTTVPRKITMKSKLLAVKP